MKNLILIAFIIFLISCNNNEKTNAIIQENKELKQKIADLQEQTTSCKFMRFPQRKNTISNEKKKVPILFP